MAVVLLVPVRHDRDIEAHRVRFHDDDLVAPGSSSTERGEIVGPIQILPGHPHDPFDQLVIERPPGTR